MTNDEKPGRVVVVGPTIMDYYMFGTSSRLDQTAAVPIVQVPAGTAWSSPGGAALASRNVTAMVAPNAFVSAVGRDDAGSRFMAQVRAAEESKLDTALCKYYVACVEGYQTPQKYRVYANNRLVSRYDVDTPDKVSVEDYVIDMFQRCVDDRPAGAILISDYNKGVCTPRVFEAVNAYATEHSVPVIVDPSVKHMQQYAGVHMILPNAVEVCQATGQDDVAKATKMLREQLGVKYCVTTCGEHGLLVCADEGLTRIPAAAVHAVDSCGAGDVVAAAVAMGVFAGMPLELMWKTATIASGLSVQRCGTQVVGMHHCHKYIAGATPVIKKIPMEYAQLLRMSVGVANERIGVANGVFDILHAGHINMLHEAAAECNFLVALVNGTESAAKCKNREVTNLELRCMQLSRLPYVDAVVVFDEDTPEVAIESLHPDVLIKGPELEGKEDTIPGAKFVQDTGGRVHITKLYADIHSSDIRKAAEEKPNDDEKSK